MHSAFFRILRPSQTLIGKYWWPSEVRKCSLQCDNSNAFENFRISSCFHMKSPIICIVHKENVFNTLTWKMFGSFSFSDRKHRKTNVLRHISDVLRQLF